MLLRGKDGAVFRAEVMVATNPRKLTMLQASQGTEYEDYSKQEHRGIKYAFHGEEAEFGYHFLLIVENKN